MILLMNHFFPNTDNYDVDVTQVMLNGIGLPGENTK